MAAGKKFKPPVFTRRAGGKHTDHSAGSGWLDTIVSNVKVGTPAALKGLPVAYHGTPPHMEIDETTAARASVAPTEPQDVPDADDMTRKIDATPYPTTPGMKSPNKPAGVIGALPAKSGASAAPLLPPNGNRTRAQKARRI